MDTQNTASLNGTSQVKKPGRPKGYKLVKATKPFVQVESNNIETKLANLIRELVKQSVKEELRNKFS